MAKQTEKATPAPAAPQQGNATNTLAIIALVLGIVAVVTGWVPVWGFLVGGAAVVLGFLALKKSSVSKGLSIAGIITGAAGALWSLIVTLFFILALGIFGAGLAVVGEAAQEYQQQQAQQAAAKKDFAKGETALFDSFEVKVNNVTRNHQPQDSFSQPRSGYEFILVNVTVKNLADGYEYFGEMSLKIDTAGVATSGTYNSDEGAFPSGNIASGQSATGNIMFEIPSGETDLKLIYEDYVFDIEEGLKTVTYSLEI